jgi:hypothetical protein
VKLPWSERLAMLLAVILLACAGCRAPVGTRFPLEDGTPLLMRQIETNATAITTNWVPVHLHMGI